MAAQGDLLNRPHTMTLDRFVKLDGTFMGKTAKVPNSRNFIVGMTSAEQLCQN